MWQAVPQPVPDVCNGGTVYIGKASGGCSFTATFDSDVVRDVDVKIHYRGFGPLPTPGSWSDESKAHCKTQVSLTLDLVLVFRPVCLVWMSRVGL